MEVNELETLINNEIEWRKELYKDVSKIKGDMTYVKVAIGKLNVKSTVWGLLGGMVPAGAVLIFLVIKRLGV